MKFFITFGSNHKDVNGNRVSKAFVVIDAPTQMEARETMFAQRGIYWSMIYNEKEFEGQVEKYNLHEVEITEV